MKNTPFRFLKIIISAAALVNLVLLFFFNYNLPQNTAGQTDSSRGLGTTISLPSRFPAVTDLDLPNLAEKLIASGSVKAADADGNDITDRITFDTKIDENDERIAICTFSVQGDEDKEPVSISVNIPVTLNRPVIVLKSDSVALANGGNFDPLDYVAEAVDASGVNIIDNTVIIGEVDTETKGTYQITLQAKDANGFVSDPKTLTVRVS